MRQIECRNLAVAAHPRNRLFGGQLLGKKKIEISIANVGTL